MFKPLHLTVLTMLLLAWTAAGAAAETMSGAPQDFVGAAGLAAPNPPVGLDDTLCPIHDPGRASRDIIPDACDRATSASVETASAACWEYLAAIGSQDRSAATIEIEPVAGDAAGDLPVARDIAALWNRGQHAEAIDALRRFEEAGARVAVGVSWTGGGRPAGLRAGPDVRIGEPRTDARVVDVDYDATTQNLFTVVGWGTTTSTAYWCNYLSTDHGHIWTTAYEWYTNAGLLKVDAAVVGDWLYVGYVTGEALNEFRVRRCSVTDGTVDNVYSYQVSVNAGTHTFRDMALITNADDYDNRVYCLGVQDDNVLRFAWSTNTGDTFYDVTPPATANVAYGLSATWDAHHTCPAFMFVSYLGTDGSIHVLQRTDTAWVDVIVASGIGTNRDTSVSAYDGNVICAFEGPTTYGTGILYRISYDCGTSWSSATLAAPDGVNTFSFGSPAVDARTGQGTAIVYFAEVGEPDFVYYQKRTGFAPGPWVDPIAFSDFDVYTGSDTALNPLSPAGGTPFDLGALYIGGGSQIPYFDQFGETLSAAPEAPASAATLRLLPASPNPFRDQTTLRFELAAAGHARLELFDLLGRHMATLLDEDAAAGVHEVSVAGRGLRSGLYVYRLTSGAEVGNGHLVLIP